jgi:putative endonuclease
MLWPFRQRTKQSIGRRGERLAARHLRRLGYRILARNYHSGAGEIDLIALDRSTRRSLGGETLVFVEVKTRSSDRYTAPESAVDARKRRTIEKVAGHYLAGRDADGYVLRFDLVSVVLAPGQAPRITHLPDAF